MMSNLEKSKKAPLLKGLTWFVIAIPVVLSFFYVRAFGVNVVRADGWDIVGLLGEWTAGNLGLKDLWSQHVDHRLFFPRIALLLLARITEFNSISQMYLVLISFIGTLLILLLAFRATFRFRATVRSSSALALGWVVPFVPVAFLLFSLRQYYNMLTGFQVTFAFGQVFSVLALFLLLVPTRRSAFIGAMVSATVASFSVFQGLFVWPAGLVGLALSGARRRAIVWTLVGVGVWAFYFVGYELRGSLMSFLSHPVNGALYFMLSIGSSLFSGYALALPCGVLLTLLAGSAIFLLYRSGRLGEFSFWIALVLFAVLFVASITVGRAALGFEQATESRYTTFSILGVIGLYAVLAKLALERTWATTALAGVLCGLILLSISSSYLQGIHQGAQLETDRERAASMLSSYETRSAQQLRIVHPIFGRIREDVPILERLEYNVFDDS
jgi:hypothetical protein